MKKEFIHIMESVINSFTPPPRKKKLWIVVSKNQ